MNLFQAIILGIVQGIAEFLPISSSGHLVLMQHVFGLEIENAYLLTFDIVVHLGSLVAILIYFWSDIWALIKKPFSKMTGLLIMGTVPALIVGLLFQDFIVNFLRSGIWLAVAFTITGCLLLWADSIPAGKKEDRDISYLDALVIGIAQAFAIPPGISRSGATFTGALARGLSRKTVAQFSFMLGAIAIAGAGLLDMRELLVGDGAAIYAVGRSAMVVGFIVSAVVGYFSINLLMRLIKAARLRYFSYYVWVLAAFILLDILIINRFF